MKQLMKKRHRYNWDTNEPAPHPLFPRAWLKNSNTLMALSATCAERAVSLPFCMAGTWKGGGGEGGERSGER